MPPPRRRLSKAQQIRVTLVSAILIVLGFALGLFATIALPHIYAAQATIRYNLSVSASGSGDAERTLTTQTVLITGREVLQSVADTTGVPVDYLIDNVSATVVENSEVIHIRVTHPDRASGIQLCDAVVRRYLDLVNNTGERARVQAQLEETQRRLATPGVSPLQATQLQARASELQEELAELATRSDIATVVAPAYSVLEPAFPDRLITLGIGTLVGALAAALAASHMIRNWTRRRP